MKFLWACCHREYSGLYGSGEHGEYPGPVAGTDRCLWLPGMVVVEVMRVVVYKGVRTILWLARVWEEGVWWVVGCEVFCEFDRWVIVSNGLFI